MHMGIEAGAISQLVNLYGLVGDMFYILGVRPGYIGDIIGSVNIINNVCIAYNMAVATRAIPVMVIIACVYILRGNEYPPVVRTTETNGRIKVISRA